MRLLRTAVLLLLAHSALAQQRTLRWKTLDVDAHLDDRGRLAVKERHAMIFDGDWNGGERVFNLRPGQQLEFQSISRIDPRSGSPTLMTQGSLDAIDHYAFTDANTLRWRSRLPSDSPFENTELVYDIVYTLSNVLSRRAERYRLSHDFAFPNRSGAIESFTLDLELAPSWHADQNRFHHQKAAMPPGEGFVLNVPLRYTGTATPLAMDLTAPQEGRIEEPPPPTTSRGVRLFVALVGFAVLLVMFGLLFTRERDSGRFRSVAPRSIDRSWLEEHVFSLPAEVVGAAWDDHVGPPEVAATLARLTAEGKLKSWTEQERRLFFVKDVLHLELLVDRHSLGEDGPLIDALFHGGTKTDTSKIRSVYRKVGFDPTAVVEPVITKQLKPLGWQKPTTEKTTKVWGPVWVTGAALFLSFFLGGWVTQGVMTLFLGIVVAPVCLFQALRSHRAVRAIPLHFLSFGLPLAAYAGYVLYRPVLIPDSTVNILTLLLCPAYALSIARAVLTRARMKQLEKLDTRKRLGAARRHLTAELRKQNPQLEDAWFPYFIAFGLGKEVDQWFRAFGGAAQAVSIDRDARSSWGSSRSDFGGSSPSSPTFTGGGGAFGGAGASGSWALAATSLASSISAPSSSSGGSSGSSSSSSSSSSGGSSGGGGGGGW